MSKATQNYSLSPKIVLLALAIFAISKTPSVSVASASERALENRNIVTAVQESLRQLTKTGIAESCTSIYCITGGNLGKITIDSHGLIPESEIPKVKHQFSDQLTGKKYSTASGKPTGIIFHKTAGRTCLDHSNPSESSIAPANRKPHVYICRDGTIIQNGTFDRPRLEAEYGHNGWSLNIEFEAAYLYEADGKTKRRDCEKPESGLHCYESLTDKQIQLGRKLTHALSQRFNIPVKAALPASTPEKYYAHDTYVSLKAPKADTNSIQSNQVRGVVPSFWTRQDYQDAQNHDDGPTFHEFQALISGCSGGSCSSLARNLPRF